jgi:taurine dioxygenase
MVSVLERQEVRVRPTGAALAADIEGVDLAGTLTPETIAAIERAWGDHLVLRFRGQKLSDDDLMHFSRQLGELDWAPVAATNDAPEGRAYVMVVSNVV